MHPDLVLDGRNCAAQGFGGSVAARDDRFVVGAPWRDYSFDPDKPEVAPPCACVFVRDAANGWALGQVLTAADPPEAEGFARTVAVTRSFVDVGAPGHENGDAATHMFALDGGRYRLSTQLDAPSRSQYVGVFEEHGVALASDDRFVVVGATLAGDDQAGEAYVFDRSTKAAVMLPHPRDTTSFGVAVAISGPLAIVGASATGLIDERIGSVFVYRRDGDGWRSVCRLDGTIVGDGFGIAVALDGERLAVGAPGGNVTTGRVDLFEVGADSCRKLASVSGGASFGEAVALHGDRLAVGESRYTAPDGPQWSGRVGLFRVASDGTAAHEHWLTPANPAIRSWFGSTVALARDYVLVGAPAYPDTDAFAALAWW